MINTKLINESAAQTQYPSTQQIVAIIQYSGHGFCSTCRKPITVIPVHGSLVRLFTS